MKDYYNERFSYFDGGLYWKQPQSNRLKAGQLAGSIDGRGYLRTSIDGELIGNHLIIWIMHYGQTTKGLCIDHRDRNKLNNRIENLREITRTQNNLNSDSRLKARGISYDKVRHKWRAQISAENRNITLGRFDTEEEAHTAYREAYDELHGDFK